MKLALALVSVASASLLSFFSRFFLFLGVSSPFSLFGGFRNKRSDVVNVGKFDALLNECLDNAFLDIGLDINLDDFLDYMSICEKKVLATVAGKVKTKQVKIGIQRV